MIEPFYRNVQTTTVKIIKHFSNSKTSTYLNLKFSFSCTNCTHFLVNSVQFVHIFNTYIYSIKYQFPKSQSYVFSPKNTIFRVLRFFLRNIIFTFWVFSRNLRTVKSKKFKCSVLKNVQNWSLSSSYWILHYIKLLNFKNR